MIVELGHFSLALACAAALVQFFFPLVGARRNDAAWMNAAVPAASAQFILVAVAFYALTHAFVTSDFSVLTVAQNSHSAKPLLYKVSGVWGNHEGSMVLWVLILSIYGALVAWFGDNLAPALKARVLSVQGLLGALFLLFILLTSNPFVRLDPALVDGSDLNPLLQDPGLAFHPPFLYLGYVGFSVAFSFAVAALLGGKVDAAWARWVRPWTLGAWAALTVGIALGSYWAYYELGWGGWWFWDPVENASLMPWLAGTALLHSTVVTEKRGALKSWTILLAILAFSLSLLGTFLVRSGVLTSVHAFANDPARGVFVLGLLIMVVGGSLVLFALRAPALKADSFFAPISREGSLVLNNLFLTVAAATVFIGTLYPLILETVGGAKISVGPPYFNLTFVPLMAVLTLLVPFGPLLAWKRGDIRAALQILWAAGVVALVVAIAVLAFTGEGPYLALLGFGIAAWLVVGALAELAYRIKLFSEPLAGSFMRLIRLPRSACGTALAHAGLGILVAGVTGISVWKQEHIQAMKPGDSVIVAGYEFVLRSVEQGAGPNYSLTRGLIDVSRNKRQVFTLRPEKRVYPVAGTTTSEAAIHTTPVADIYAVLGEPQGENGADGWAVRLYYNPLVVYIWVGAVIMAFGGVVSLTDRRLRVGLPARRRARRQAASIPAE